MILFFLLSISFLFFLWAINFDWFLRFIVTTFVVIFKLVLACLPALILVNVFLWAIPNYFNSGQEEAIRIWGWMFGTILLWWYVATGGISNTVKVILDEGLVVVAQAIADELIQRVHKEPLWQIDFPIAKISESTSALRGEQGGRIEGLSNNLEYLFEAYNDTKKRQSSSINLLACALVIFLLGGGFAPDALLRETVGNYFVDWTWPLAFKYPFLYSAVVATLIFSLFLLICSPFLKGRRVFIYEKIMCVVGQLHNEGRYVLIHASGSCELLPEVVNYRPGDLADAIANPFFEYKTSGGIVCWLTKHMYFEEFDNIHRRLRR